MMSAASLLLVLASVAAQEVVPVPPPGSTPVVAVDMAAYDAAVQSGQARYLAGDFLGAAQVWRDAAGRLPRTPEQRGNVAAIHAYVADAYDRAMQRVEEPAALHEALAQLDAYALEFAAAYPDAPANPRVEVTRERLRQKLLILDAVDEAPRPAPIQRRPPPLVVRPWRPLAAGGGVVLAMGIGMVGVFAVGLARTKAYEDGLQTAAMTCQINNDAGPCGGYYDRYRWASTMQLTGLILGPVLVGGGVAMLIAAAKRKRIAENAQVAPMFGRGLYGVGVQGRF